MSTCVAGEVSAVVKTNYLIEVYKEVLNDLRFSTELESSHFSCALNRNFCNRHIHNVVFKITFSAFGTLLVLNTPSVR